MGNRWNGLDQQQILMTGPNPLLMLTEVGINHRLRNCVVPLTNLKVDCEIVTKKKTRDCYRTCCVLEGSSGDSNKNVGQKAREVLKKSLKVVSTFDNQEFVSLHSYKLT